MWSQEHRPRCAQPQLSVSDVSLCIPVYNSSPFLDPLFACLTRLDPAPAELLFLDDASTDDSLYRVMDFAASAPTGAAVRLLTSDYNTGIAAAYNRLAREASKSWVQLRGSVSRKVSRSFFADWQLSAAKAEVGFG